MGYGLVSSAKSCLLAKKLRRLGPFFAGVGLPLGARFKSNKSPGGFPYKSGTFDPRSKSRDDLDSQITDVYDAPLVP